MTITKVGGSSDKNTVDRSENKPVSKSTLTTIARTISAVVSVVFSAIASFLSSLNPFKSCFQAEKKERPSSPTDSKAETVRDGAISPFSPLHSGSPPPSPSIYLPKDCVIDEDGFAWYDPEDSNQGFASDLVDGYIPDIAVPQNYHSN